jgi:hypothetical protein
MKWQTASLDTLKAPISYAFVGGPFGSNLTTRDYVEEGVPVIRGNNLPDGSSFYDDAFVFVSEKKADELRSNTAFPGDLVFTQRGTLGQVGLIPFDSQFPRYIISQSQMKLTVNTGIADPRFIFYFFRLPATVQSIINHASSSGVPHINLKTYKKYQAIIADYNREKDRATVEATFAALIALAANLDTEQRRAAEEGLSDQELALFDLLFREMVSKADRERLKQASKSLLASLKALLQPMPDWTQKEATQAEVKIFILDDLYRSLPRPPFTEAETEEIAEQVYDYVWQRSSGQGAQSFL